MKKTKIILPILIVAVCCLFAACTTKPKAQKPQLNAPQNLHKLFDFLVWDEVENASGYVVYMEGTEYETEECRYSLSSLSQPGEYVIEVCALGDWENYKDSEWSKYNFTVNEKAPLKPTANLAYSLLADGSGYEVSRGKADLNGTVVFPDEYNGLPVKRIADFAFCFQGLGEFDLDKGIGCNTKTTGFILPETLEEIGFAAFCACTAIEEIVIPEGVKIIGENAFIWDIKLKKVELPSTLTVIDYDAFSYCAFSEIELPESLNKIGHNAFFACHGLSKITIPKGVTRLENSLFERCESLKEIKFSSRLEFVGDNVFKGTAWIANSPAGFVTVKTVNDNVLVGYSGELPNGGVIDNIPSEVTHIARGAFPETGLVSITIPEGVTFAERCFLGFTSLKKAILPEGMTNLPRGTFNGCTSLNEVILPKSLTKISDAAFLGCSSLNEIILPASIESFGLNAFYKCPNLKIFYDKTKNDWLERKPGNAYMKEGKLYLYAETEGDVPADGGNYWHYVDGKPVIWE